jgi:hypothetical protein
VIADRVKFFFEVVAKNVIVKVEQLEDRRLYNTIKNTIDHVLSIELAPGNKKEIFPDQGFEHA